MERRLGKQYENCQEKIELEMNKNPVLTLRKEITCSMKNDLKKFLKM